MFSLFPFVDLWDDSGIFNTLNVNWKMPETMSWTLKWFRCSSISPLLPSAVIQNYKIVHIIKHEVFYKCQLDQVDSFIQVFYVFSVFCAFVIKIILLKSVIPVDLSIYYFRFLFLLHVFWSFITSCIDFEVVMSSWWIDSLSLSNDHLCPWSCTLFWNLLCLILT